MVVAEVPLPLSLAHTLVLGLAWLQAPRGTLVQEPEQLLQARVLHSHRLQNPRRNPQTLRLRIHHLRPLQVCDG